MGAVCPAIEGIPFRNALIIENNVDEIKELKEDLRDRGMCVVLAEDSTKAENIIKNRPELSIIVLDWYLNEDNPMESQLILENLKDTVFAPIIIYTKMDRSGPETFIKERGLERVVKVLEKSEVTGDAIFGEMSGWISENPELRIFLKWAYEIEKTLNPVLWKVYEMEAGGLRALLEIMKCKVGEASYIPPEYDLSNLFLKVLTRDLHHKSEFFSSLSNEIQELREEGSAEVDREKSKRFHGYERYIKPPVSRPIWTGDILKKSGEEYFVVVTPSCDLFNPGKVDNILLLRTVPFSKYRTEKSLNKEKSQPFLENNKTFAHYLPYIEECPDGLLCLFEQIKSRRITGIKKEIRKGKLERIATIDSPFIENLLQRMNAYLMRLGVRELEKEEINQILNDTSPT